MIAETSSFISQGLSNPQAKLPAIPTRRVDQGGFTAIMRNPISRLAVKAWWDRAFRSLDD